MHTEDEGRRRDDQTSYLTSLVSWPLEYINSLFATGNLTTDSISSLQSREEQDPFVARFKATERFSDSFEEQLLMLSSSSGFTAALGDTTPPEYSLHGIYVPTSTEDWPTFAAALPDISFPRYKMVLPKKTKVLALDLDETLVHSTSKSSRDCDFFVEVLVDRSSCLYYVFKRPFVDQFLETVLLIIIVFEMFLVGFQLVPFGYLYGEFEGIC